MLAVYLWRLFTSNKGCVIEPLWDELDVWLGYGAEVPVEAVALPQLSDRFSREVHVPFGEDADLPFRVRERHMVEDVVRRRLGTYKSTTLGSLIRCHEPKNVAFLLENVEAHGSLAEDQQKWNPHDQRSRAAETNPVGVTIFCSSDFLRNMISLSAPFKVNGLMKPGFCGTGE